MPPLQWRGIEDGNSLTLCAEKNIRNDKLKHLPKDHGGKFPSILLPWRGVRRAGWTRSGRGGPNLK